MVIKASADANKTVKQPVAITIKGDTSIPENKSFMVGRVFYDCDFELEMGYPPTYELRNSSYVASSS